MNETIRIMKSHRCDRSFTGEPVSKAMLTEIISAAQCSPNSVNGQQISLVVVRDPARRARIAEIAGGQPWVAQAPVFIAVVIDFYKAHVAAEMAGLKQVIHESMEGFGVGAVDAGIILGNLMTAARSLGLGIVPIGGIRRDPQAMIDLLELPPYTFPIDGLCIGHVAQQAPQKPRLPLASFWHDETYHREAIAPAIKEYDAVLTAYWKQIGRPEGTAWSTNTAGFYRHVYFPNVRPVAAKQGFLNDK
jgi:FMN reductase [NAD(P)H]